MKLFHGTTKENLKSIELDGVASPSYWGTESLAQNYANSFGNDGVVLVAAIDESALEINKLVAEQLYENGDIEEIPDENDLTFSLQWLEGVVCTTPVFHAKVLQREAPEPATSSQQHKYPKPRHCDDEGFEP